jgi:phosphoglucomutase
MMTESMEKLNEWLGIPGLDPDMRRELEDLKAKRDAGDEEVAAEIEDRFYRDLEFGTAGLRGALGAGSNRMNVLVVRRATQGYAERVLAEFAKRDEGKSGTPPRVAVAFDNRRNSDLFAFETACVFVANGIETHLYAGLSSTPMLSWTIRELKCDGGVVVTASHNPKRYNGYKIYDPMGNQCLDAAAKDVAERISRVNIAGGARTVADRYAGELPARVTAAAEAEKLLHIIPEGFEITFVDRVREATSLRAGTASTLSVAYTPLNGTGSVPVRKILADIGVGKGETVPEQRDPDPDFTTCPEPTPETAAALKLGLELCRRRRDEGAPPDLLIGTDPDCDRVGCAVYDGSDYVQLTGNQVGVLLFDYIAETRAEKGLMPERPVLVTTIVSTPLTPVIADRLGVATEKTLTGFKYIGDLVNRLEEAGEENRFIFGFEESCGYCAHTLVRDKDGVGTSMLLCEMAGHYKKMGKTLLDKLAEIGGTYGYYIDAIDEFTRPGREGMDEIRAAMDRARAVRPGSARGVEKVTDYLPGDILPSSNVIRIDMADGGRIMLRPSGTEPKLKAYYSARGSSEREAEETLTILKRTADDILA